MAAISTRGLEIYLVKGSATGTVLVPTAISSAKPAKVTVAATTGLVEGQLVNMAGTAFPHLDGKQFVVGKITATDFELLGSDTTGSAATLGSTPKATAYANTDMELLCLSQLDIGAASTNQTSVATFCDPSAQIGGLPTPGQLTVGGYVDPTDKGMAELVAAEADAKARGILVKIPNSGGYLIGVVTVGTVSYTIPLEGAVGYSAIATQNTAIRYVH